MIFPFSSTTCSERGCSPGRNPQRRANWRGYAALLAQSLDNLPGSGGPLQVDHIPTPGCYDDGVVLPEADVIVMVDGDTVFEQMQALARETKIHEVLEELDRELVGLAPVKARIRDIESKLAHAHVVNPADPGARDRRAHPLRPRTPPR